MHPNVIFFFSFLSSINSENFRSYNQPQTLESLSRWNWELPPPPPSRPYQNKKYDPLKTTKDAARIWTPNYPTQITISNVRVRFSPVCDWPEVFDEITGLSKGFNQTFECPLMNNTDVSVLLAINYSVHEGYLKEGFKSIADAPHHSSPVPWIKAVQDGEGVSLNYSLYRDTASKEWWIHYIFAAPTVSTYTVQLEYQIRQVLTGEKESNRFAADWLQEWDAPVEAMDIHWVFPPKFKPTKFSVSPRNNEPDFEPSQLTAICCGNSDLTEMAKCTYDLKTGLRWASEAHKVNSCVNQSVVLVTNLRLASGMWANDDAGVNLNDVYSLTFSPGLVTNEPKNVKDGKGYGWILPLLLILLFPCLGAIFWTLQSTNNQYQKLNDHAQ